MYCQSVSKKCSNGQISVSLVEAKYCNGGTGSDGRGYISGKATCEKAALILGIPSTQAKVGKDENAPRGCSFFDSGALDSGLQLNSGEVEDIKLFPQGSGKCSSGRPCLCMTAPTCTYTEGDISNVVPCLCGTTVCMW